MTLYTEKWHHHFEPYTQQYRSVNSSLQLYVSHSIRQTGASSLLLLLSCALFTNTSMLK